MSKTVSFEELEFAGAMAVRFLEVTIDQYEGTETFDENDAGLSRIQHLNLETIDGSGYRAAWNEETGDLQLFDGATEAATDGTVTDVTLRAQAIGRQ